jgi:hypothetical protein
MLRGLIWLWGNILVHRQPCLPCTAHRHTALHCPQAELGQTTDRLAELDSEVHTLQAQVGWCLKGGVWNRGRLDGVLSLRRTDTVCRDAAQSSWHLARGIRKGEGGCLNGRPNLTEMHHACTTMILLSYLSTM